MLNVYRLAIVVTFATVTLWAIPSAFAGGDVDDHLADAQSLYEAGHWNEAAEAYEKAYRDAEDGSRLKASTALDWGSLLWEQGNYPRAEQLVREALEMARDLGLDEATGELLSVLGHIEASMGELSAAENTLNICVQLTGEMDDDAHRALCRINRRSVRKLKGEDPGSDAEFQRDIETLGEADTAKSVGVSLTKSAELYRDNEDYEKADELLDRAGSIYRDIGSVPSQKRNRLRRAQLELHRDDLEEARRLVDGLLESFREMNNHPLVIHTLAVQAEDAIRSGDLRTGIQRYREALSVAERIDNPQLVGRSHLALCEINFAASADHCEEATDIFDSHGMNLLEIRSRSGWARTLQQRQDYEKARHTFRRAIDHLEETVDTSDGPYARTRAFQYANLCQVDAEIGTTGGYGVCTDALDALEDLDDDTLERRPDLQAAAVHATGRTAVQAERISDALDHFEQAAELYVELGEPERLVLAADILLRRGAIEQNLESTRDDAPETFTRGLEILDDDAVDFDETADAADTRVSLETQLAQHYLNADEWTEAIDRLEPLVDFATDVDHHEKAAWAYSGLANAYLKVDRRDDAIEALERGLPLAERAEDDHLVETFEQNIDELAD